MRFTAHKAWPTKWHFGFKNGSLYGSPWLDAYIDPEHEQSKFDKFIETYCVIDESDLDETGNEDREVKMEQESKTNSTNPKKMNASNGKGKEEMDDDDKKEEESVDKNLCEGVIDCAGKHQRDHPSRTHYRHIMGRNAQSGVHVQQIGRAMKSNMELNL